MIPYGRQDISDEDIEAVVKVLKSDFLTQGPAVAEFEKTVATYCGVPYGTAICNATAGLHIAYLAAGLGPGDILWTTPNTFAATANAALMCGAKVDFTDIDPRTYNLSPDVLEQRLIEAEKENRLPKIVVPVHFAGQSADMVRIHALSKKYGFIIIEDAAHAIGADYMGQKVGSCQYSDMCVFSFHPVKIITTGEGGMVMTKSPELHQKLQDLRTHGITRDRARFKGPDQGPWFTEQQSLGYNYRITDLQCALGTSQMKRIDPFVQRRRELVKQYNHAFSNLSIQTPFVIEGADPSWHLYVIQIPEYSNKDRLTCFEELRDLGLGVNVHYIPVHTHPYYQGLGFAEEDFPVAESYYKRAITLPLYSALEPAEAETVIAAVTEVFQS
jgi:UDP-4-amino-4,6-dideoxy-N-acetyl-beta-L-altrosamine transaminase